MDHFSRCQKWQISCPFYRFPPFGAAFLPLFFLRWFALTTLSRAWQTKETPRGSSALTECPRPEEYFYFLFLLRGFCKKLEQIWLRFDSIFRNWDSLVYFDSIPDNSHSRSLEVNLKHAHFALIMFRYFPAWSKLTFRKAAPITDQFSFRFVQWAIRRHQDHVSLKFD